MINQAQTLNLGINRPLLLSKILIKLLISFLKTYVKCSSLIIYRKTKREKKAFVAQKGTGNQTGEDKNIVNIFGLAETFHNILWVVIYCGLYTKSAEKNGWCGTLSCSEME